MAEEVMGKFWGGVHWRSCLMLQFNFLHCDFAGVLRKEFHKNTITK
jgi:hypothetical protein